ncbi:MAG: TIGR04282 family arsenosugar biosynthesis glycosyltransferase [Thermomicrobiales bacterium]|jgi:rSAM/selenodomain-associated transferase 1
MLNNRHLVIFTRYPRLGTGKRRLAAQIGAVQALRFQRVSLTLTLQRLGRDDRWNTWLAVTPDHSGPWPRQYRVVPQGNGDLGDRLGRIAKRLPIGPVLIVGSDVPSITTELISRGFHLLEGHDAVLGPSEDGGYWAIGLRRRPRTVIPFRDVRWSTQHALSDTLSNLNNCTVARLAQLEDVDDGSSLSRFPQWSILHGYRFS